MIEIWNNGKYLIKQVSPRAVLTFNESTGCLSLTITSSTSVLSVYADVDDFWLLVKLSQEAIETWYDTQNRCAKSPLHSDMRSYAHRTSSLFRLTDREIDEYYQQGARYNPLSGKVEYRGRDLKISFGSVERFRGYQVAADNAKAATLRRERPKLKLIQGGKK